ncbi:unnamed protein product, partial [Heterosigma akashiwo]
RESTDLAESQQGFINFLVKPLFASWVKYINTDEAACVTDNLENNLEYWKQRGEEEKKKKRGDR